MEKPAVRRGRSTDKNGKMLEDVSPPEYFSDMAQCHWKEFECFLQHMLDDTDVGYKSWRFLHTLPGLDPKQVGQPLPDQRFQEDFEARYDKFFKTFGNIHDGELLELEGAWMDITDTKPEFSQDKSWQQARMWHVQYATNPNQRESMEYYGCLGTRPGIGSTHKVIDEGMRLPTEVCENIGMDTSVHRINGQLGTHELRTATVVTWPQLFIMGAHAQLTALEVYTVGIMCELIMSRRAKSKGGLQSRDKFRAKQAKSQYSATAIGATQAATGTDQAVTPGNWWQTNGWQDAGAQWWQTRPTTHGTGAWVDRPSRAKDWPNTTPEAWYGWGSHQQQ